MNLEEYREYCLRKAGVSEHLPFDIKTLVFKAGWKIFSLTDIESFEGINLKSDPERTAQLREEYPEITLGHHMSKIHWNTVSTIGNLTDAEIYELIEHSYQLVYESLTRKQKERFEDR